MVHKGQQTRVGGMKRERAVEGNGCPSDGKRSRQERSFDGATAGARTIDVLNCPLGPEFVAERSGPGGVKLSYLEGCDAYRLANHFFGNSRWSTEIKDLTVSAPVFVKESGKCAVSARCRIKVTVHWPDGRETAHEDVGYGGGAKMAREGEAVEIAVKEAMTDGLKRALRQFGNGLGNCLYDKDFVSWQKRIPKVNVQKQWNPAALIRLVDGRVVVSTGTSPAEQYCEETKLDAGCSDEEYINIPGPGNTRYHGHVSDIAHPDFSQHFCSLAHRDLEYLACFNPGSISIDTLEEYKKRTSSELRAREALDMLIQMSLIRCEVGTQEIRIHRLVRGMVLDELRTQNRLEPVVTLAMDVLAQLYDVAVNMSVPAPPNSPAAHEEKIKELELHVKAIMDLESVTPYRSVEAKLAKTRLLHAVGHSLLRNCIPHEAERAFRASLRVYDSLTGFESHRLPLVSILATACRMQGRHTETEKLEAQPQGSGPRPYGDGRRRSETEQEAHTGTRNNANSGSVGLTSEANEDEEPWADDVEIKSVLSNFLPSLTAGSTISASLTLEWIDDIRLNVLTILTKDDDLRGLLRETPKRVTHDRFQRNFLRLFRSFLDDIRKQPDKRAQELHQVIRVLRYQSRNIASHICQEIFDLKAQSDALSSLALQVPNKNGQLMSFLGDDSTIFDTACVHKGELPLDNNSSGGGSDEPETVQPYPIPLGNLENIILRSTSFSTFRERYRAFLFPRPGLQSLETNTPKDVDVDVAAVGSEPPDLRMRSSSEEEGNESLLRKVLAHVLRRARRLVRPPVKNGHVRIEWICDCGDDLYADFPESDGDSVRNLEMFLQSRPDSNGGSTARPGVPAFEEHHNASSASPPPQPLGQPNSVSQTPGRKPSSQLGGQGLTATGTDTHASRRAAGRAGKRFIELCVNTGEFQRQLAEIDISDVKSDAQLFDRIRQRYREVRSFRVKYFLLKPVDVHFVQFSVEDRHRVGILDKPMAIPSQAEMAAEGYGYHPCPLKPPPIPPNIFLHHLSNPGPHKTLLWGNRIPQKLHRSILQIQAPDNLVIGWGVHVIEGLNKFAVLLCALAGLLVSGLVATAWAVARDDVQGGFGIGAWLTSVELLW